MIGILIFFPPMMAVFIHYRIYKIDKLFKGIYIYLIYIILTNLLTFSVIALFFSPKHLEILFKNPPIGFFIKCNILSIFFSILLSIAYIALKKKWVSLLKIANIEKINLRDRKLALFCIGEVLLSLSVFLLCSTIYLLTTWSYLTAEEIIFHVISPIMGASKEMILKFIYACVIPAILIIAGINIFIFIRPRNKIVIKVKTLKSYVAGTIFPFEFLKKSLLWFSFIILIFDLIIININFNFLQAYKNIENPSNFIEENYIDPKTVEIVFPETKRNLIFIYVESLETTYLSTELGGAQAINLIPELTQIAEKNVYFSNNNLFGGGMSTLGSNWTVASIVTQTSGLPLKLVVNNESGKKTGMLPNAYSIGEILEANGYTNEFIMGSDAAFSGRDLYLQSHGNYKLLDYMFARNNGIIPEDYHVWWGFEDQKLYAWAKEEAIRLSKEEAPFNLTLLTVDTHHVGGYVCNLCANDYKDQYANVVACASRQLYDFVTWAEHQDFFENTTIIIIGDHTSMDPKFFKGLNKDYERRVLNVFINSALTPLNAKNRQCSLYDMFPTTLAALGAKIQGDRLGLGANLFSDVPTIAEQFSSQTVANELEKFSTFYLERFW